MNKKQETMAKNAFEALKKNYTIMVMNNSAYEAYDINAYRTAKCMLDFPDVDCGFMANAAEKAGYSTSTINNILNGRVDFDMIEPYVMREWEAFMNKERFNNK